MNEEIAIKVDNASKDFRFNSDRSGTIKSAFTSLFKDTNSQDKKNQHALKNISFEVKKGEFFGIVGRNGSGKSTLLKMLAGIYQPTKGKIHTRGKLVPFIELGVGFNPELTGKENVYLNGAMLGFSKKEVAKFYDEVVEFAELGPHMDKQLKNYSSGMQVRLAFSMAIRAKADVLLIDEVLAVGDADFQRKCFEYFNLLKSQKTTVIFVSHDMEAVRQYCDRAILINDGLIAKQGKPDEVAQAYIKLFMRTKPNKRSENSSRWGEKKVTIDSIDIDVNNNTITIKETLKAHNKCNGIIAGIRIRSTSSDHVLGTNTKIEHNKIGNLIKGEQVNISWRLPNILSDGEYYVDPAVISYDEITVYDWWEGALEFSVRKNRRLPYTVDPGFKVDISRK